MLQQWRDFRGGLVQQVDAEVPDAERAHPRDVLRGGLRQAVEHGVAAARVGDDGEDRAGAVAQIDPVAVARPQFVWSVPSDRLLAMTQNSVWNMGMFRKIWLHWMGAPLRDPDSYLVISRGSSRVDSILLFKIRHPQQAAGDSVRRQVELTAEWCRRNGVRLDESISLRDEGVSAFRGKHRENPDTNALAAFVAAVHAGKIAPGSYLIVESLDRLSREKIRPALTLLLNLIESGIKVVQLLPIEVVYDEDVEPMQLLMAVMESRAL